ncbi:translation factor GUF1 homolog, mitochondrial isoform X1, partial [Tanacetum coccineum]
MRNGSLVTSVVKSGLGGEYFVERERGITVKAQTATMFYNYNLKESNTSYLLNLIDTPGHVDFSYEVSRSLAACQGALLVVDAAQDSYYDEYKGVICHVAVVDGSLRKGDKIMSAATGQSYEILDVGIMHPELRSTGILLTGQVGYIVSGMRSTKEARIGDTLSHTKTVVEPLAGFKEAKHMVFSGLFPADGSDFEALNNAIERLTCNDASVSVARESSTALGLGFRCGFLGLLHMDVFHQRLEQLSFLHRVGLLENESYTSLNPCILA